MIVVNGALGIGLCNSSTKYWADRVAASADENIGILIFLRGNSMTSEILSDIFSVKIICNTYGVLMLIRYTTLIIHACSMWHIELVLHVQYFFLPMVPWALR